MKPIHLPASAIKQLKNLNKPRHGKLPYPPPRKADPDNPLETVEQIAIIEWLTKEIKPHWPIVDMFYHPANEGKRSQFIGKQQKSMGLRRGIPDLIFPVPNEWYIGLAIELKRRKGTAHDVTPTQRAWLNALSNVGWRAVVCFGADQAKVVIRDYIRTVKEADYVPFPDAPKSTGR